MAGGTLDGLMENMPISPVSVVVFNMLSKAFGKVVGERFPSALLVPLREMPLSLPCRAGVVWLALWLLLIPLSRTIALLGVEMVSMFHARQDHEARIENEKEDRSQSRGPKRGVEAKNRVQRWSS